MFVERLNNVVQFDAKLNGIIGKFTSLCDSQSQKSYLCDTSHPILSFF